MQEILMGLLNDPLMIAAASASLIGLTLYFLYGGFIHENQRQIAWFRRLFLPHITRLIRIVDDEYEEVDIDGIYVETDIVDAEHAFDLYLDEAYTMESTMDVVGDALIRNHFRPEVLLASLGTNPQGLTEVGNYVLTAPEKDHSDTMGYGRLYDIFVMFVSKYQLHVRIFYDPQKHRLRFYAHHELNPYNPFKSKKHLKGEKMDYRMGVLMFEEYRDEIAKYGIEVAE